MPANRRYDLGALWRWMQAQPDPVTARDIARHLHCSVAYVHHRILPDMERLGYTLAQISDGRGCVPSTFGPMNDREK